MSKRIFTKDPEVLSGTPVFAGTRVPVRILLEHLEAGDRLDDFLDDYPSVSRQKATGFLELIIANLANIEDEAAA